MSQEKIIEILLIDNTTSGCIDDGDSGFAVCKKTSVDHIACFGSERERQVDNV